MEQQIDLSTIVGDIAGVMFDPYTSFFVKLHAAGRITDAELEGLRQEVEDQISRLDELVAERLNQDRDTTLPPPPPDQA